MDMDVIGSKDLLEIFVFAIQEDVVQYPWNAHAPVLWDTAVIPIFMVVDFEKIEGFSEHIVHSILHPVKDILKYSGSQSESEPRFMIGHYTRRSLQAHTTSSK